MTLHAMSVPELTVVLFNFTLFVAAVGGLWFLLSKVRRAV